MSRAEYPIGRPYPSRETLPAVTVSNEVVWVNPNLNIPFDLRLGQPCDLGMLFLMRGRKPETPAIKTFHLEIMDGHNRSGLLGRVILSDNQGNGYRDVDVKGTGMFGYFVAEDGRENAPRGLLDLPWALEEAKITEKLHSQTIPTYRVIAIMRLSQLLDETSQPREIAWFKERRIIHPERTPVIAVRAFVIKTRLSDINYLDLGGSSNYRRNNVSPQFLDGLALINQQYHVTLDPRNPLNYLKWLAKTIGLRLALFQRKGWFHDSLSQHNITIDGRIVDCAAVKKTNQDSDFYAGYARTRHTLIELGETISAQAVKEILEIFERAYKTAMLP